VPSFALAFALTLVAGALERRGRRRARGPASVPA
jgi:hypothetical protein